MNDFSIDKRKRHHMLLIVEGNHEKNILLDLIFKCFPEIKSNDILIYGTNIYQLYEEISKEYNDWIEEDVDLPYIVNKKLSYSKPLDKYSFNNILIVFDYERHDPNFSEEKILKLQHYFTDETDMGQLYINYPMVESYQHLIKLPDKDYISRRISVNLKSGRQYKLLVMKQSVIYTLIYLPHKINDYMHKNLMIDNIHVRNKYCNEILNMVNDENIMYNIYRLLENSIKEEQLRSTSYLFADWINNLAKVDRGKNYWEHLKSVFVYIVYINICKCNIIQNNTCDFVNYREYYNNLDLVKVLEEQNKVSNDENGFIWILNTSVLLVANYKFFWNEVYTLRKSNDRII